MTFLKSRIACPDLTKLALAIFLGSLIARLLAVQALLTVDEATWMARSIVFVKNLAEFNLIGTYSKHHPGVTLMWLDGFGFVIHWIIEHLFVDPSHLTLSNLIDDIAVIREQKNYPISIYVLSRVIQAFITSGLMVALFLQTRKLLGQSVALLGIGLLLFEPFFLGYQRLLLTDVLQINLMILSLVSLLLYLRDRRQPKLLAASGAAMGLATATKVTALFVVPAIVGWIVLIELGAWKAKFPQQGWKTQIRDLAIWGMTALASIFVIWPALWVSPGYVLTKIVTGLQGETERGLLFFMGETADTVGASFYPVVLFYRLSPLLLVGTLIGLLLLAVPKLRSQLSSAPELTALVLASLSSLLIFSATGNKLDRYILSAVPGFAFLAAAAWLVIVQRFRATARTTVQSEPTRWQRCAIISLITVQFAFAVAHYPYYLTYFNPLLGGAASAQKVLMIGNGEGLDQAANWLNQLPEAEKITVGSGYGTVFAPYFQGQTLSLRRGVEELEKDWLQRVHYLVVYINQFQRQLPSSQILNYFAAQKPLYTVRLQGVDYVQVYPGSVVLPAQLSQVQVQQDRIFSDVLRLRGYEAQEPARTGQPLIITLYWEVLRPPPQAVKISVGIKGSGQPEASPCLPDRSR